MRKLKYVFDEISGEYLYIPEGLIPNTHTMREVTKEEFEQHTLLIEDE